MFTFYDRCGELELGKRIIQFGKVFLVVLFDFYRSEVFFNKKLVGVRFEFFIKYYVKIQILNFVFCFLNRN